MTLTSATIGAIDTGDALNELIGCRSVALYMAWLLAQRQRRTDYRLAALTCLDGRGRLASMLVAFYMLLRRKRLITAPIYHLPLSQIDMGNYLGLNVVHVNRVLRSLREEHVAVLEKHCVTIHDLEQLRSLASSAVASTLTAGIAELVLSETPQAAD
jgi:CRP-like cAMP-binding protein